MYKLAKVIIVGLAFTVMAVLSWAAGQKEPTYPPYCWAQPPQSDLWYPCDSQELKDANCLNLMETAMKAVDPYLDMMTLPEDTRERVLKLWGRAKNECWSDLKNLQPQHYH